MSILKEINDSLRERDPVEIALENVKAKEGEVCKKYLDPNRVNDFAATIADLMKQGSSFEDAKGEAFDETEVPPNGSPCCKLIKSKTYQFLKESLLENAIIIEGTACKEYLGANQLKKIVDFIASLIVVNNYSFDDALKAAKEASIGKGNERRRLFGEIEQPPKESQCFKLIKNNVEQLIKKFK